MTVKALRSGARSLSAAAMAAAALTGCAPVLHDADLVPARAARLADAGPTRTDSAYANAVAAIDRRDYARALELLQMARQQSAGDVRVLNAMGVVYDKLGRFDLSARYYAEAARADPSSPIVQANIDYSRRLRDGSAGAQVAQAPIFKVAPPAQTQAPSVVAAASPEPASPLAELQARRPAAPERIAAVAPPQQLQAESPMRAIRMADLSQPGIGAFAPFQSPPDAADPAAGQGAGPVFPGLAAIQPVGPLQRVDLVALLTVGRVAGLAGTPSPQIAPAPSPVVASGPSRTAETAALQPPAASTTPPGPLGQIELVTLIKAGAAAGLSRLAALRFELPEWNAPTSSTGPGPAASIVLATTAATAKPAVLRLATPALPPRPAGARIGAADRQPLRIVNAAGRLYRAEPLRASLAQLGWSAPRWAMAEARPQTRTVILYPPSRMAAAKALARTLPGSARLAACAKGCAGLRLVLGVDARSWKPVSRPITRTRSRNA